MAFDLAVKQDRNRRMGKSLAINYPLDWHSEYPSELHLVGSLRRYTNHPPILCDDFPSRDTNYMLGEALVHM
jgi:hypothetical protein